MSELSPTPLQIPDHWSFYEKDKSGLKVLACNPVTGYLSVWHPQQGRNFFGASSEYYIHPRTGEPLDDFHRLGDGPGDITIRGEFVSRITSIGYANRPEVSRVVHSLYDQKLDTDEELSSVIYNYGDLDRIIFPELFGQLGERIESTSSVILIPKSQIFERMTFTDGGGASFKTYPISEGKRGIFLDDRNGNQAFHYTVVYEEQDELNNTAAQYRVVQKHLPTGRVKSAQVPNQLDFSYLNHALYYRPTALDYVDPGFIPPWKRLGQMMGSRISYSREHKDQ